MTDKIAKYKYHIRSIEYDQNVCIKTIEETQEELNKTCYILESISFVSLLNYEKRRYSELENNKQNLLTKIKQIEIANNKN